jgi:SAM-dependent methyltransferase
VGTAGNRGNPWPPHVLVGQDPGVPIFETVADEYDRARPDYPPGVYEALGALEGLTVLDVGAGTGIATRELLRRGASVIAIDPGSAVLARAAARTRDLVAVAADGAALPMPDRVADLVCFAQAWHWLDPASRTEEAHRVLREHGRWAGWWSHARADGREWFDEYWSAIERVCVGTSRDQRDTDWGATVAASGLFKVSGRVTIPWLREITVEDWLTDQVSHSYVAALPAPERRRLVARLRALLDGEFHSGLMAIPYETWLWIASKR